LGVSDITNTNQQSFYAVADRSTQTTYANPRSTNSGFVMQTLSSGTCPTGAPASVCTSGQSVIKATSNAVDWSSQNGWYIDFINTGERAFTDPSIGLGTLLFTTVVPSVASADPCASPASANSYIYALNYLTGGPVSTAYGVAGLSLGAGAATRPVMIELTDGTVRSLTRISDGKAGDPDPVVGSPPTSNCTGINCGTLRRVSWRELTTQ
jgi:type IV pilus assembly protein PilY1